MYSAYLKKKVNTLVPFPHVVFPPPPQKNQPRFNLSLIKTIFTTCENRQGRSCLSDMWQFIFSVLSGNPDLQIKNMPVSFCQDNANRRVKISRRTEAPRTWVRDGQTQRPLTSQITQQELPLPHTGLGSGSANTFLAHCPEGSKPEPAKKQDKATSQMTGNNGFLSVTSWEWGNNNEHRKWSGFLCLLPHCPLGGLSHLLTV